MSQSPYAGVPDDDDDDDDLGGGPAAGSGSPAAPPFSPTGATASEQMMLRMFQQMAEATKAASEAATAAANALAKQGAPRESSTAGYSDANRILKRPDDFGSPNFDYDLAMWQEWLHGFKSWLIFADSNYESELQEIDANLSRPLRGPEMSPGAQARSQRLYAIFSSLLKHNEAQTEGYPHSGPREEWIRSLSPTHGSVRAEIKGAWISTHERHRSISEFWQGQDVARAHRSPRTPVFRIRESGGETRCVF